MSTSALITTSFTASSTADEVLHGVDLTGVRAMVTGSSSGIGAESARTITAAGAQVTLAVRDTTAGDAVAEAIKDSTGALRPRVLPLDFTDRASVIRFVEACTGPLHLLNNNAGLVTGRLERAREGWKLQLATNHLGHFVLATGLHDALARGAAERDGARIVALSSTAHTRAGVDFDDLHFERRRYDPQIASARSKTANSLSLSKRPAGGPATAIVANVVNPGGVATGLQRHFTTKQKESLDAAEAAGVFTYKTIGQGAATSMVAAVAPELAQTGGQDLDDGQEAYTVPDDADLAQQRQAMAARPGHRDPTLDCLDRPSSRLTSSRPERQPELR